MIQPPSWRFLAELLLWSTDGGVFNLPVPRAGCPAWSYREGQISCGGTPMVSAMMRSIRGYGRSFAIPAARRVLQPLALERREREYPAFSSAALISAQCQSRGSAERRFMCAVALI